ncbi:MULTISPECIES: phosphate regulon sensor histidine kinase PhoR [Hydrocarboniphaga]|jgi:two-component system phosphate regulon sensor histidine kinase PhoR|uniref:Phosphate regulon sensor protein PhoR n=1 Tax=Hydrocarboniphaga effusa AP103 TaxID=1172194 RepID=I7Z8I2_9GAMM|nr:MULTISPECIES: phosphate regulon sensor histidine kinase PhoR [Hydrocarboniphaga]EIT68124.1 hypothetical protein WQQ_45590 [Hydrocarboniphaga effusa AP103]MDZ4078221.1 phosphate regulon sensor histidine kinase PhoR [Hydrocarboniphaga sp.]
MAADQPASSPALASPAPAAPKPAKGRALSSLAWRQELVKLTIVAAVGLLVGQLFSHLLAGFTLAIVVYLANQMRHLRHLRLWLMAPKHYQLPEPSGIWGEVFEALQVLDKRNRKRKKKLAEIVAEFQASTAALPDGAVVLGEHGEILWFNRAAQSLLGLRSSQDVGIRIANLIRHPNFTDYIAGDSYSGEVEVPSPINRNIALALRIIPYGNNQRLMIVRDISEVRRLEHARRDFVSNASHELRTPLTVLRGYLDMLEPDTRDGKGLAAWRMPVTEMRNQAVRMESLINDMLKLARLEADGYDHRLDVLDIPSMLARTVEEAKAMSKGQHRFEVNIQPQLFLCGREIEAQSILSNLVTNAVRYTPPGGVIRVNWWGDAEGAHFSVVDSGIGIEAADIPRLTERFYRVDVGRSRASGGTGLGLSIVKHALERHDGRLRIDSELGAGSTFRCDFPPHRVDGHEALPVSGNIVH